MLTTVFTSLIISLDSSI